jgi:hypothetical protein
MESWDKKKTLELVNLGLSWDHARQVVGLIAEERQTADREGYKRGYNNGYEDAITNERKKAKA